MSNNKISEAELSLQYIAGMRPVFNKRALFSDMTEEYVCPAEPSLYGTVTIRFRTGKNNVDSVSLVSDAETVLMRKQTSDEVFDYYAHTFQLENEKITYYFEVRTGKVMCFYDLRGVAKDRREEYFFVLTPGLSTPRWAKGAVMYQIYVDRFYNGDPDNDVQTSEYSYLGEHVTKVEDWNRYPNTMGIREFYGGDLQGVLDKLDYIQGLGVDVIYFNPLFVSPSNHKYDIQDYDYIDPHFGKIVKEAGELLAPGQYKNRFASKYITRITDKANLEASNAFFAKVVEEIHNRGMRVILDGVFNHCGSFNKWMDRERIYENQEGYEKGAFVAEDSPYRNYFQFFEGGHWPYNHAYDGWWGHDTLPKLNYEASWQLYDYILKVAKKWVSPPYNVDGWRLDVAADLGHSKEYNHKFWKDFRKAVKEANPEAIVLAEHYGTPREWLQGDQWDTVMNYDAFMEPITWFLTGMQKHSDDYRGDLYGNAEAFFGAMRHHGASFSTPALQISMNELSNHDHSRFLTRTNKRVGRTNTLGAQAANEGINKAVLREAVVVQMTWPGAPTIYYGDEAGVCGFTDPDNRRTYPWGKEDLELIAFHRDMIRIHKETPEMLTGSIQYLYQDYNVIAYGRFQRNNQTVVVVNNNEHEITCEILVWELGVPKESTMNRLILTRENDYTIEPKEYLVLAGKTSITLGKTSAIVLRHTKPKERTTPF